MSHLVIRCGHDIRDRLKAAGLEADYLSYDDPFCQGPVQGHLDETALIERRATFIADSYGHDREAILQRLRQQRMALAECDRYDRIVLWLEHDLYDQITLIHLLHHVALQRERFEGKLFLLSIDHFPGVSDFKGFGSLETAQLAELIGREQPVTDAMLDAGHDAWQVFTGTDLSALKQLAKAEIVPLPFLGRALERHLRDWPDPSSGLGLTERLALEAVVAGADTPASIFTDVNRHDPLPFLGDLMFYPTIRRLAAGRFPALSLSATDRAFAEQQVELTATGRSILAGQASLVQLNGIDRWFGGIHLIIPPDLKE